MGVMLATLLSAVVSIGFAEQLQKAEPGVSQEEAARKSWLEDWNQDPRHARLPRPKEWYAIRSDIGYEQVNLQDGSRIFRRKRPFGSWLPADCTTMAPSDGPSELRFSDPIPQTKPIRTESVAADFHAVDRDGFTIRLRVDVSDVRRNERLYAIPNGVQVYLRLAERKVKGKRQHPACTYDSGAGNYVNFPMPDGTMPVIEALFPAPAGRVGIPLGLLERPFGEHEVVVNLSHAHVSIVVDGKYVDEDLPFCAPGWPKDAAVAETYSPRVRSAVFSCPAEKNAVPRLSSDRPLSRPVQYWTPDGHNAWVGDVVTGWHDGRYHVFYLCDRRHHYSKAGKGGHFFAHLTTKDMAHWTEHPHALPIVHRWEAQGTGTPFLYRGQYCLAYGYHTERMPNNEGLPIGATYAVSDDGITFRRTEKIIGEGRNPAIFNRADGMLGLINSYLCTPGLYESDHPGDWKMIDADLPLDGDCPCLFDWNGRSYLLQGFTGFASSPNGKPGTFENWNKTGDDIYEGLSVPMVSPFSGDRRIMAGWLSGVRCEWGGWLVLRELVAYPDGRLGTKWVPECVPDVPVIGATSGRTPVREPRAIYTFENLSPQEGFRIELIPEKSGEKRLNLTIDPVRGHAQFNVSEGDAELPYVKTMYEHMLDNPAEMKKKKPNCWGRKGRPDRGGDFAIGKIRGLDRPWGLRLAVWYDKKADATIVDAELAGQRTMITRHPGRFAELVRIPTAPDSASRDGRVGGR